MEWMQSRREREDGEGERESDFLVDRESDLTQEGGGEQGAKESSFLELVRALRIIRTGFRLDV
jgi:hypothetical protein